jgi:hypothetical protein
MISVFSNEFPHRPSSNEVSNVRFTFANGHTVSLGMSAFHYCSPRSQQGLNPERESVELAVILSNGAWGTREAVHEVLGYDPGDDVAANVSADDVARIIAHVQSDCIALESGE